LTGPPALRSCRHRPHRPPMLYLDMLEETCLNKEMWHVRAWSVNCSQSVVMTSHQGPVWVLYCIAST
jgi:hypothetical protein